MMDTQIACNIISKVLKQLNFFYTSKECTCKVLAFTNFWFKVTGDSFIAHKLEYY